jgi:hypothetical protein
VGAPETLAIPVAGLSPTWEFPAMSSVPTLEQTLPGVQGQDRLQDDVFGPANKVDRGAARQGGPIQPSPRNVGGSRLGTMLALLVGVLGVATIWPMVAVGLVVLWALLARFADRSITSLVIRRHDRGLRRSDIPLAIAASPWHAVLAVGTTLLNLFVPAVVTVGATFVLALASAAVTGGVPQPDRSLPLLGAGFLGLLMCWWGPGGASLQRGSRSLLRAMSPGKAATDFVVATFILLGVGLGAWAWVRNGQPDWWPWSVVHFQAFSRSFW